MRERGLFRKFRWALLAAVLTTVGILASAEPDGNSRLVSVQQLPQNIDECMTWDKPVEADARQMTSSREKDLFAALQQDPSNTSPTLVAAAQEKQKDGCGKSQGPRRRTSPGHEASAIRTPRKRGRGHEGPRRARARAHNP